MGPFWFHSICARKYKLSTLQGDIYRCHYTCTTFEDRDRALKELTELYVRNEYPRKLIETKIQEIRDRNFISKGKNVEYQELRKRSPELFYTLCIPYTASRCEKVMSKLIRLLKINTPQYRLNVAWRSEKLQKLFSHKLKLPIPPLEKVGTTYKYDCLCEDTYIGESKQQLRNRIKTHNQKSGNTAISNHIYGNTIKNTPPCPEFNTAITTAFGVEPKPGQKRSFISDRFTILQSNLMNTRDRKTYEAVAITIQKPILNAQVFHRKVSII